MSRGLFLVACVWGLTGLFSGCGNEDGGGGLQRVDLEVDFDTSARAIMTAQTPAAYRINLLRATLRDPQGGTFDLFSFPDVASANVYTFQSASVAAQDLLPPGVAIPEGSWTHLDLAVGFLEMQLDFKIGAGAVEARTLRIYFTDAPPYLRGDVALIAPENPSDNWAFGPGNLNGADPELMGLARAVAYQLPGFVWPDGRPASASGPFGDQTFWGAHPEQPFVWQLALPANLAEGILVIFRVGQSWHFTDQNEDGVYDWPSDYGNAWNMDFPGIVAEPRQTL